jgi:hypothetical protein
MEIDQIHVYVYSAAQHPTRSHIPWKYGTNAIFGRNVSGNVACVDFGSFHLRLNSSLASTILQATWVGAV